MSEIENPSSKLFAQPLAMGLGVWLLLGYVCVTGFAIYEKSHRASIEHAAATTGVGDNTFFTHTFDATLPLVNFEGHSLYFVDRLTMEDSFMAKVGMDDGNTYAVYKLLIAPKEDSSFVYLKIGPNYYLKTKRQ